MYLYKLELKENGNVEVIYLLNNRCIDNDAFKKVCDIAVESSKRIEKINKEYLLEKLQWKYGFIITQIQCENVIDIE